MTAVPAGWPADLPGPAAGFEHHVVAWLLDRLPPEYRTSAVKAQPIVLALAARHHAAATLEGARQAYRDIRTDLRDVAPAEQIDAGLVALEALGAQFARAQREVDLVYEAMLGQRWRPRL